MNLHNSKFLKENFFYLVFALRKTDQIKNEYKTALDLYRWRKNPDAI